MCLIAVMAYSYRHLADGRFDTHAYLDAVNSLSRLGSPDYNIDCIDNSVAMTC